MATNNEIVFKLCETRRFCEDLKEKGYRFNEDQFQGYSDEIDLKKNEEATRSRNSLAFDDSRWKQALQPRHFYAGYTVHGFHFCICSDGDYHVRNGECICKLCEGSARDVDHLSNCPALSGTLYEKYKNVYYSQFSL